MLIAPEEVQSHPEWNRILDKYLSVNELESHEYEELNSFEKSVIQEIKKAIKRLNNKNEK